MENRPLDQGRTHSGEGRTTGNVLLHWVIFIVLMSALIGGAAMIF